MSYANFKNYFGVYGCLIKLYPQTPACIFFFSFSSFSFDGHDVPLQLKGLFIYALTIGTSSVFLQLYAFNFTIYPLFDMIFGASCVTELMSNLVSVGSNNDPVKFHKWGARTVCTQTLSLPGWKLGANYNWPCSLLRNPVRHIIII